MPNWGGKKEDKIGDHKTTYTRGIGLISRTENGGKEYYHFNIHGDIAGLSNSDGTITKDYGYDAFGNQLNADTNDTNPFRYCGEYWDAETGNIYLRARYYDPSVGRFISEDPIRDGLNWYAYCGNNPVNFVDPWGLAITTEDWTAYYNNEISDFYWNLLNEADAMWRNAMEDDYTTKATARRMAVAARMSYNSGYVDDFDYTFGTGASAFDDGSLGVFMKTATGSTSDGHGRAISVIVYERTQDGRFEYLNILRTYGYGVGDASANLFATRVYGDIGQSIPFGIWETKEFASNNSTFFYAPYFTGRIIDDKIPNHGIIGSNAYFVFNRGGEDLMIHVGNMVYDSYYYDEKGGYHAKILTPSNINEGRGGSAHFDR